MSDDPEEPADPPFEPVPVRPRHDGWTPDKQIEFIEALAESGCVEDAAKSVGMGIASAYRLRCRADAIHFRMAWDAALQVGISRLSDAAMSRAIHGVTVPVFYKGEQIGERKHYDERLTMFLLRYRDMTKYGKWIDRMYVDKVKPDGPVQALNGIMNRMLDWLYGFGSDNASNEPEIPDEGEDPESWPTFQ